MRPDVGFDACYRSCRGPLLHETFLLTGDRRAAVSAVRDAFIAAWQHWDRVTRLDDPTDFLRPLAWRLALRRHRGRIWHRNKGISDTDKATLDALHRLPVAQRRVLLASDSAELPLERAAIQSHLSAEAAQLQLTEARDRVAAALDVAAEMVPDRLREVTYDSALTSALPRPTILMREGSKRRRVRAATLVVGAVSLVLVAGVVVADPHRTRPGANVAFLPTPPPSSTAPAVEPTLATDQLIDVKAIAAAVKDKTWRELRTDSNSAGDGLNSVCQTTRYADPLGLGALVRVFTTKGEKDTAVETLATSRTQRKAKGAYQVTLGWFGGCSAPRVQLTKAYSVEGLGDRASLVYLKQELKGVTTQAVGIAQVGTRTVSIVFNTTPKRAPAPAVLLNTLTEAAMGFCGLDCVNATPSYSFQLPRIDSPRGLLAAVDLPPVGEIKAVWVGVKPKARLESTATSECGTPELVSSGATNVYGRTYLIPQAALDPTFGAEESVGTFSGNTRASAFVKHFSAALVSCAKKDFTVDLTSYGKGRVGGAVYWTWLVQSRVNRKVTLQVRVGLVRNGSSVAVVAFTPATGAKMDSDAFKNLTRRAAARL